MAAILNIYGDNVFPIKANPINRFIDRYSAAISAFIDFFKDYINPLRYTCDTDYACDTDKLWIEIFSRLSVKSLMVVMCVCKHWKFLIKDPRFTLKHLRFQKMVANNNGHFLLHHDHQIDMVTNYYLFNGESFRITTNSSSLFFPSLRNIIQFPRGDRDISRPFIVEGPINGLYCLHNEEGSLVIWNPATIEVGFLPLALECVPADKEYLGKRYLYSGVVGFGVDPLDEENYKVILISPCYYDNGYSKTYAMLYTTRTNTWRHLKNGVFCEVLESLNNTYLKGSYYWMSELDFNVLAFDMSNESFRFVKTPCNGNLALHNDCIYLFDTKWDINEIDIWMMTGKGNWLKIKNVRGIQGPVVKTLGFWKTENDLLIVIDDSNSRHDTQTILYNTTTGRIKHIGTRGYCGSFKAIVYYESLVSLSGEIVKYKGNDNVFLLDKVRAFLQEVSVNDGDSVDYEDCQVQKN